MSQSSSPPPHQTANVTDSSVKGQIGQAGRDLWQLQVLFGGEQERLQQAQQNRQALIDKVRNFWVKGVLEKSLHQQVLIQLDLENRTNFVDQPFNIELVKSAQAQKKLPAGTKIVDLFNDLGQGCTLLILGEPGAGKTISLLELARDLLNQAEQDVNRPISVVFNLASWRGQPLSDWLVQELQEKYQVSKNLGKDWVKQEKLTLLLDGLDEVRNDLRNNCTLAINEFIQKNGSTNAVVCSRVGDYEVLAQKLKFQDSILIASLTQEQIRFYLSHLDLNQTELEQAIQHNPILQNLARVPLTLNFLVLAFQGEANLNYLQRNSEEEYLNYLFDAYIKRMLFRRQTRSKIYSDQKTKLWLSFLAQKMMKESQSIFLIEKIQPNWLVSKKLRITYRLINILIGIIFGWKIIGPKIGTFAGGAVGAFSSPITPKATLKWSWLRFIRGFLIGFLAILAISLILGFVQGILIGVREERLFLGLAAGLIGAPLRNFDLGVIVGFVVAFFLGFRGQEVEKTSYPNQGIRKSLLNSIIFGFAFGIMGGILVGFAVPFATNSALLLRSVIISAFAIGAIGSLVIGGGKACIQHLILRCLLSLGGNTPWNYAQFLDYATERIFLQKVGGGYIFVHRLLLEHFATMQTK
ncbi:NACHT domain-containing protein [Nodosilinea sp. LEGE 07088]|uniref:NACHT domain-containing protein n=1 Tax=Nodosilinea sp. LEGE 07088 TaxID=2777968 RepID=UPI001881125C|nr:NACHT domain-containing protein [Nodosilinea sp. LEGE 07088]MBE9137027.1 NACHT domain-containing protein [Nodosilinea sp. LEGE 07088]